MFDNRSAPRPTDAPAPSQEAENRRPKKTLEPPKHFETRSEWEEWRKATFPSQQKFEKWQKEHRAEDIESLRNHMPDKAMEHIQSRGHTLAYDAAKEAGYELTNIRSKNLRDFVLQNHSLAHHALNPSFLDKAGNHRAWGAASFVSAERTLNYLKPIAKRHGINLEGLSLEDARGELQELRYALESESQCTGSRGRMDRQSAAAIKAIRHFNHQYAQGLRIQEEKAEQLWAAHRYGDNFPDYVTTAGENNQEGLAVAMRRMGPDSDGNGRSDAYDTHLARSRMRTGAGLSDPKPEPQEVTTIASASLPSAPREHLSTAGSYISPDLREYRHWTGELEKGLPMGATGAQTADVMFKHYALNARNYDVPRNVTREEGAQLGLKLMAQQFRDRGDHNALKALQQSTGIEALGVPSDDPMYRIEPQSGSPAPVKPDRTQRPRTPNHSLPRFSTPQASPRPQAHEQDPFAAAISALNKAQSWYASFQTNTPGESMEQALARVLRFRESGRISSAELATMAAAMKQYAQSMDPSERAKHQDFAQMLGRAAIA